jgi:membrane protease YdiL (CAAX protease family)
LNARGLLYASDGALRAPWRVVIFLLASVACTLLGAFILSLPFGAGGAAANASLNSWSILLGLLGGHVIMLRWVDRRPWSSIGLGREDARAGAWLWGFVIGVLAIGIPIALLIAFGWLDAMPSRPGSWIGAALRLSIFLLPAALNEELLFRGYLFALFREKLGTWVTLAATSILFGLVHFQNTGSAVGSIALVTLAGVFLGAVLIATRSLYAAWMAHFAWNWTMAVLFHTAVSGLPLEAPNYRFVDGGPDWATGGVWGPEGGIPAGLGMLAGLSYLLSRRRRREES